MKGKFFRCSVCGNVVYQMNEETRHLTCCGKEMEELVPSVVDVAAEKHVPCVEDVDGRVDVQVGSIIHPMLEKHYIEWVAAENEDGNIHIKYLKPGDEPKVNFCNHHKKIRCIYAYCNLHGLWVHEI